ncbi:MAG: SAM-dependent methyltransferase [Gammaproteobacteria bacterium]|nr:SAM-dependent methyltransferase [Gammaproteobacteria bacterium]MDE2304834.1 SAM-dependent methyltransferase [Gammaproteobacteria bacterium]
MQREPEDPQESGHAQKVLAAIENAVREAGGWIPFDRYMEIVLYAPGLGYYSAGARKLGASGDFTTAPEISALFGACLARQCAQVLADSAGDTILEVGAGSGRLAVDLLRRLEASGAAPARYMILEVSADLRERQRASIASQAPELADRVQWLDEPPSRSFTGVIVANEVLDALPVTRFRWRPGATEELGVVTGAHGLEIAARAADARLAARCEELRAAAGSQWREGYVSEYCPRLGPWCAAVAGSLAAGAVLWFDYGLPRAQYYLAERDDGTLIGHYRHRVEADPLARPGLQDLSAWVDFTALAEAGDAAGFDVAGYTTQAYFLAATGIDGEMRRLAGDDARRHAGLASEARRLLLPGEMGERFKAMAWTRGLQEPLIGFALRDLRHTL